MRPAVQPNEGFLKQLSDFEAHLKSESKKNGPKGGEPDLGLKSEKELAESIDTELDRSKSSSSPSPSPNLSSLIDRDQEL